MYWGSIARGLGAFWLSQSQLTTGSRLLKGSIFWVLGVCEFPPAKANIILFFDFPGVICVPVVGISGLLKDVPVILFSILVSDKFQGNLFIMSGSQVLVGDTVALGVFPAFSSGLPIGESFNMIRQVITRAADNKESSSFIDITGDNCQGDGLRSLTCVMF